MASTGYSTTTYEERTSARGPVATTTTTTTTIERSGNMGYEGGLVVAPSMETHMVPVSGGYSYQTSSVHGGHSVLGGGYSVQGGHSAAHGGHSSRGHSVVSATGTAHGGRIISTVNGEARETGETHIIGERTGAARYTGETRIVEQFQSGTQLVDTRVVGVEKGAERQVSVTEVAVGEEIIGEHTVATGKGRRGKKIIREEVIEKVIVVPETVQIEEWVEDEYDMEETVVEVAKKFQIEKIVEVPEIEIVEKVIEQVEKVIKEKVVEVPKIQTIEKIVEIPIIQTVEKVVEVPEVQYRDIPVEKIVEVPEYQTEEVIREVKKAQFVDKPIEQKKLIADHHSAKRRLPVPVEAETIVEFTVPHIRANYIKKKFPVYLPRFIEVPVSRQFIEAGAAVENDKYCARLKNLTSSATAVSLCEIEKLASQFKEFETRQRFTDRRITMGASVDETTKRTMFSKVGANMQQYALYKHLPIEVGDVHLGHYSLGALGSAITYSSAKFGGSHALSGGYAYGTSHVLPAQSHTTTKTHTITYH